MTEKKVEVNISSSALVAESVKIIADGDATITVGESAEIREHAVLEAVGGGSIAIGDRSIVGYNSWVHGSGGVTIGNDVMIGPSVAVTSSSHRYDLNVPMYQQGLRLAPVVIEDDVWIGANATIAAGSHISKGAVIAAGALVKGHVPPAVIAAGSPARVVSTRKIRTVLFYTLPLVLRQSPLLFECIFERYVGLAKSYEALGWRCIFAGTDELADKLREHAHWRSPRSFGITYPQNPAWMDAWKAILAGQSLPLHQAYLDRLLDDVKPDIVYCWNFDGLLRDACNARSTTLSFNELGLSRAPNPVTYYSDPVGVNSTASMTAFWETYQAKERAGGITPDLRLRTEEIVPNYRLTDERRRELIGRLAPRKGRYLLVLLQVSDDSNIVAGSAFTTMQSYVDYCVAQVGEHIDIVVKPHPAESFELAGQIDGVTVAAGDDNTCELIGAAGAVATINSSAGFEAAMAEKAVYVLGNAPYSGLGVTIDARQGLRNAWLQHEERGPADLKLLDRVADFAFHHYFFGDSEFFDAGAHLSRFAEWQGSAEPLGPLKPYLRHMEIDRYLMQIRDLQGKCARYEEWIESLKRTADDVERVSTWATTLKAELESAQAEMDLAMSALALCRADAEMLRGQLREVADRDAIPVDIQAALETTQGEMQLMLKALDMCRSDDEALRSQLRDVAERSALENQRVATALREEVETLRRKIEEIYASRSWRASAALRALGRMARHPATAPVRRIHTVVKSRGGYVAASRLAFDYYNRNGAKGLALRLKQHFRTSAPATAPAPLQAPAERRELPELPPFRSADVIVFGVIDWHFRFQRPQQLSLGFANRGHRVFYVSSELIPADNPGFCVSPIPGQDGVYQVRFHVNGLPNIYGSPAPERERRQLLAGLAMLVEWTQADEYLSIVHHPFWLPLARALPRSSLVYDCMDHHEGFGHSAPEMISAERALMAEADALVVTSNWLYDIAHERNVTTAIVRNACEFGHFSVVPENVYQDRAHRRVIGYYGAIAEWFDIELVSHVAEAFPDCLVLLIGADTCGAQQALKKHKNVSFIGEVPYKDLPFYLYGFDICLLPFRRIDLTLATNPVKVYEYLCSGKPVVSVDLPELRQFGDLVLTATRPDDFVTKCQVALDSTTDAGARNRRIEFARQQTWEHRAREFEDVLANSVRPMVSIVVVTYNNLDLTKKCLDSIERHTLMVRYEVIIVDNASQDGTPDFLRDYAQSRSNVHLELNNENRGFSAANNQGLALGKGEYLVVLNNDTVVTSGWAMGLIRHLRRDPTIGLIGPVTNNIGNEAKVPVEYQDLDEMPSEAARYTLAHMGQAFDIRTLAFFCVMVPRTTYERIGGLDEAFGLGFFEDDDYCRRVQEVGMKCVCAEDVFVHHNLSASFNKLGDERKRMLMEKNRRIYEAKWGPWVPHEYRR